jgi:hypothetical protein
MEEATYKVLVCSDEGALATLQGVIDANCSDRFEMFKIPFPEDGRVIVRLTPFDAFATKFVSLFPLASDGITLLPGDDSSEVLSGPQLSALPEPLRKRLPPNPTGADLAAEVRNEFPHEEAAD